MKVQTVQPLVLQVHWLEQFQSHLQTERRLSGKSVKLAVQHVRVFSLWHEAKFEAPFTPHQLTNYDLHLYRAWSLDQEKVKAATWNSRHWALGILCAWVGYHSLMDGVEQKAQVRSSTQHRSLTDNEYHRLVRTLEQDTRSQVLEFHYRTNLRNCAAMSLMLQAGLRVEEVSMLTAEDITVRDRSGHVLVRNGKGSKERTVPLNRIAREALAAWLAQVPATADLFNLSTRSLQRIVNGLGRRINVPDLTPHWLRYTFAKRLEKSGQSIETIRDLLGHNSIETTRRYLRSSLEELQSAVDGVM